MAAAENNGKLPATLDALTNELASDKALTDPVSGKPFVYVAGGEKLDELQSNSVLAYSPENKKSRAVLLADGRVQTMNAGEFDDVTRRGLVQRITPPTLAGKPGELVSQNDLTANRPASAAAPALAVAAGTLAAGANYGGFVAGGGGAGNGLGHGTGSRIEIAGQAAGQTAAPAVSAASNSDVLAMTERRQLFKTAGPADAGISSLNNNSQRFRQTLTVSAKPPPVLATFEIRQHGNSIAIVDRDGSVYTGSLLPEIPAAQAVAPTAAPLLARTAKDAEVAKKETQQTFNNTGQNNYYFRVAGQNRTSKQNVVFVGNVIPLTNATSKAQQNQPGGPVGVAGALLPATNSQMQSQSALFANSRITGTVTVDATNQIKINAVPVAP